MKLGLFHFELLYNVLQEMHFLYDEEEMATMVLARISEALNAEAGTIFRAEKDGTLFPLASYGVSVENLRKVPFKVGTGVVGWVGQYVQPVKVDKPEADPRFLGAIDTRSGFKTRNIVACPILVRNELIGIIEFLNRRGGPFVAQDLELVSMVGRQVGIAMINARVITERDNLLAFQDAVFGSLSAGLLLMNEKEKIIKANGRALEILNLRDKAPIVGQDIFEALLFCTPLAKAMAETAQLNQPKVRQDTSVVLRGSERKIGFSTVPITSKEGKQLGVALLFQDITAWQPSKSNNT